MENWTEPSNQSGGSDPPKIGSLELCDSVDIHSWLLKPSCPFDFSELSNLNVDADADLLATIGESPAAATIETLTLNSCMLKFYDRPNLHLAPFVALRRLTVLSTDAENGISITLRLLSTVSLHNRIHEIIIIMLEFPRPECTRFDQDLVSLKDRMTYLDRIGFSCPGEGLPSVFPLLSASRLLHQSPLVS
ncbi:hypothetical protein B0H14DRAFT_1179593 [Mycena olivaceomarginata]|nr:hypothetical protein B0H14DRAFT_1179593 [Mycena olivaceomarginata]